MTDNNGKEVELNHMSDQGVTSRTLVTRVILALLIAVGLIWFVVIAAPFLEALVIAGLLAYLLTPIAEFLARKTRLNRTPAAVLTYLVFILILAGIPTALGTLAVSQVADLQEEFIAAIAALEQTLTRPIGFLGFQLDPSVLIQDLGQMTGNALSSLPGGSLDVLSGVTENLLWGLVIFVSLYYFLKDGPKIKPWLIRMLPEKYKIEGQELIDEIDATWSVFIRVQVIIFLVLGVLILLGTGGVILLFRAGLLPFSWIGLIAILVIIYTLIQQVDNLWLRPRLLGDRLALHPGLIIVALLGALGVSGVLGALLVVPLLATLKIILRFSYRRIYGSSPWDELEDQYQTGDEGVTADRENEPVG